MARPTIYSEEKLELAKRYADNLPVDEVIHSIEGLAIFIDVNRDTIYAWCKINKEFSDIVEKIRERQARTLVSKGLDNTFNASITKVMLTKHGYREGIDQTTNDKDIPTPVLVKFIDGK
jgi:hypothetical protein